MGFDKIKQWLRGERKRSRFAPVSDTSEEVQESLVRAAQALYPVDKTQRFRYFEELGDVNGPQPPLTHVTHNVDQTLRRTYIGKHGHPRYVEYTDDSVCESAMSNAVSALSTSLSEEISCVSAQSCAVSCVSAEPAGNVVSCMPNSCASISCAPTGTSVMPPKKQVVKFIPAPRVYVRKK